MDKSDETTLALVEAIRKRPIAYSGVIGFNSFRAHTQSWIEVAAEMGPGVTVAECKERWKVVRRSHSRFLEKGVEWHIAGIHERLRFLDGSIKFSKKQHAKETPLLSSSKFNVKLVKLVEQHPWLYDDSPRSGAKVRETWQKIASLISDKVTSESIKSHWQWLRKRYVQFTHSSKQDRPERIVSHMHFLKPFLKIANSGDSLPKPAEVSCLPKVPQIVQVESHAHLGYNPEDQDTAFLLSILPHLKAMTGRQQRQFRIEAITLSANVLDDL